MTPGTFRALGLLPLGFFAAYAIEAARDGRAGDALWMCHAANLALGLGMMLDRPGWIRMAAAWITLGIPLWAIDMVNEGKVSPLSTVSHLGGFLAALFALSRVRAGANPWLAGLAFLIAMQLVARLSTAEVLNVNLAWRPYTGFDGWPGGYLGYWVALVAGAAFALWGVGRIMRTAFPPRSPTVIGSPS